MPRKLRVDRLLGEHRIGQDTAKGRQEFERAELRRLGWPEADLVARRKSDPGKVTIAARLRADTTMMLKWVAERLRMGSWKHLNGRLYEHRINSRRKRK